MRHGTHQTSEAFVVCLVEDFCKSPSAPVGYMVSQKLMVSERVCATVHGRGTPVLNMSSRLSSVIGNEAGTGGGVVSGVNLGMCRPVAGAAKSVRAEGQFVLRHGTIMAMNCAGIDGPENTFGKVIYSCPTAVGGSSASPGAPAATTSVDPSKYFVNVNLNDLTNTVGAIVNLPLALLLKGVALIFPQFGQFLRTALPETLFGTNDKNGFGNIGGNNDGKAGPGGETEPGVIGIAMALAHLEEIWGDEVEFEKGQKSHDEKVNPGGDSNFLLSFLETIGQGLGIMARRLGVGSEFCSIVKELFGAPNGYGFVQGVFNGAWLVP